MYEYYWGYTAAQIELASADAPMVAYKKREKTKEEKLKGYTREKAERDYQRWLERKKKRKFDLQTFLGTGDLSKAQSVSESRNKGKE